MPDTMKNPHNRFNPIDDSDPLCDTTHAALCIYGIDPDVVTQMLGIKPTRRHKKGAPTILPSGKEIIGTTNSWVFDTEKHVSSKDLRTHLDWLLDKVEPSISQLEEIQQLPNAQTVISVSWWSAEAAGGSIALWHEQMGRMAKANLDLELGFTYYGDDENEGE